MSRPATGRPLRQFGSDAGPGGTACRSTARCVGACPMTDDLSAYATRPVAFFARYVRLRAVPHAIIVTAVALAVGCSVATQYGVKLLVDVLANDPINAAGAWFAFGVVATLITVDNLSWRVASWVGNSTFVGL